MGHPQSYTETVAPIANSECGNIDLFLTNVKHGEGVLNYTCAHHNQRVLSDNRNLVTAADDPDRPLCGVARCCCACSPLGSARVISLVPTGRLASESSVSRDRGAEDSPASLRQ